MSEATQPPTYCLPPAEGFYFGITGRGGAGIVEYLEIDLVAACQRINEIRRECKAAGQDNFEHVAKFIEWVHVHGKGQTDLTMSQADALIDACEIEYLRQKKAMRDLANSLSFTGPPPSDFPNEQS